MTEPEEKAAVTPDGFENHPLFAGEVPEEGEPEAGKTTEPAAEGAEAVEETPADGYPDDPQELKKLLAASEAGKKANWARFQREKRGNERLEELEKRLTPALEKLEKPDEPPEEEVPDKEVDPSGYAAHEAKKTRERVEALAATMDQDRTQSQQKELLDAVEDQIEADTKAFRTDHPDYDQAEDHWLDVVIGDLEDAGATDTEIENAVVVFEIQMAAAARKNGSSVPEMKYRRALRTGYKPQTVAATDADEEAEEEEKPPPPKSARIERSRAKREKGKSMSSTTGRASKGGPKKSLKAQIADMDVAEYAVWMRDMIAEHGSKEAVYAFTERG